MLAAGQGSLEEHCSGEFLESTLIYLPPRWDPGFTADMDLTEAHQVHLGPPREGQKRECGIASGVITVHLYWVLARRKSEKVRRKGSSGGQQSFGNVTLFLWHQEPCSGQEVEVCIPASSRNPASSSNFVRFSGKPVASHLPDMRKIKVLW